MSININLSDPYHVFALLASERIRSVRQRIADGTYETAEKLDVAAGRMLDELVDQDDAGDELEFQQRVPRHEME